MARFAAESPVALEHLDDHLKALLRLKLREFVHLSPWFKNVPSVDPSLYTARRQMPLRSTLPPRRTSIDCPHHKPQGPIGRRYVRQSRRKDGLSVS